MNIYDYDIEDVVNNLWVFIEPVTREAHIGFLYDVDNDTNKITLLSPFTVALKDKESGEIELIPPMTLGDERGTFVMKCDEYVQMTPNTELIKKYLSNIYYDDGESERVYYHDTKQ